MFITKKHLSRRTFLRAGGATIGLPLLDAMIPAATALSQTAAAAKPRMGFFYLPHGAIMANTRYGAEMNRWTPDKEGRDFDLKPILEPFAPQKKYMTVVSGLGNRAAESPAVHAIHPGTWLTAVQPPRSQTPNSAVSVDQIAARAHRPGHAAAVARGRDRGRRRQLELRRDVRLQLRAHDLVPHADDAAADGGRSGQGVRAHLRPRQVARGAHGDRERLHERARPRDRARSRICNPASARTTARSSTTISTACARSSGAIQLIKARDLSIARPAGDSGRRAGLRRAAEADVRHDRARVPGEHDADRDVHDGGRGQQPDRTRTSACRTRSIRCRITQRARRRWRSSRSCRTTTARCSRSSSPSSRRRRTATRLDARQLDLSVRQQHEQQQRRTTQFPLPTLVFGGGAARSRATSTCATPITRRSANLLLTLLAARRRAGRQGRRQHGRAHGGLR